MSPTPAAIARGLDQALRRVGDGQPDEQSALVIVVGSSTATCPAIHEPAPTGVPHRSANGARAAHHAGDHRLPVMSTRIKMPSGIIASVNRARAANANGRRGSCRSSLVRGHTGPKLNISHVAAASPQQRT